MIPLNVLLSGFLLASSLMTIFIVVYSLSKKTLISNIFALTCLAIAVYSFGYSLELVSPSLEKMLFWNGFQYLGIPFITALWVMLALKYTGRNTLFRSRMFQLGLFFIPFITVIVRHTNEFHYFFYTQILYDVGQLFPVLYLEKGPWYFVNFLYAATGFVIANYLFYRQYKQSTGLIKRQCFIMFLASILPWVSTLLDLLNLSPYGIDFGPFTTTLACILFLIGLFKYDLFNIKPLAKDLIFACTEDGILILDTNYSLVEYNPSASQIIPQLSPKDIGKDIRETLKDHEFLFQTIKNNSTVQFDILKDGVKRYYAVNMTDILAEDNDLTGYVITINDISRYVEMLEKLNELATKDDLTGVFNRRHFLERSTYELERVRRNAGSLGMIIFDLDHFKEINDTFGHQAGDHVLIEVSHLCLRKIRTVDILGRFGGEEFVLLLPDTGLEEAGVIAERIRHSIQALNIVYENLTVPVTASFGVSGKDSMQDENLNDLLKKADQALYKAKEDGRNCVRVNP